MTLLATALDLAAHGCSVIPVVSDGTKRPAVDWKTWQSQRPGETELRTWFTDEPIGLGRGHGHQGIGVITQGIGTTDRLAGESEAIQLRRKQGRRFGHGAGIIRSDRARLTC